MLLPSVLLALSPLWAGLEPGPHSAGFETLALRDYSRPFRAQGDERTRELRVSVWYPAVPATDQAQAPIPFGRYVGTQIDAFSQRLAASGHPLLDEELTTLRASKRRFPYRDHRRRAQSSHVCSLSAV